MDFMKSFSRRFFWVVFVIMILLGTLCGVSGWMVLQKVAKAVGTAATSDTAPQALSGYAELLTRIQADYAWLYLPILAGALIILTLLIWFLAKAILKQVAPGSTLIKSDAKPAVKPKKIRPEETRQGQSRLFLYLLSLFQREGRLLDFLSEDLDLYQDEQIGAAVRSIHANCRKVMDKNLAPAPVLDQEEGEEVTVPEGFDPAAIKLTGNVTGNPPFKGRLRHKGWRAKRLELPSLSEIQNVKIIAPAEVEVE
jgi:uncharacterized protein DUF2760